MNIARCHKPSPGQLLLADHEALSPEPGAYPTSLHSAHTTPSAAAPRHTLLTFSRRSSSFQFLGPHRIYSLCLAHSLPLLPLWDPAAVERPQGSLTTSCDVIPHYSPQAARVLPSTHSQSVPIYLLNVYGFHVHPPHYPIILMTILILIHHYVPLSHGRGHSYLLNK